MQEARDAAVDIIQKKQRDEDLTIFIEGLLSIRSVREMECLKQSEAQELRNLRDKPHINRLYLFANAGENKDQISPTPKQPGSTRIAPSLRTEILKVFSHAWHFSGPVQISFLQGLQTEDYACIALHFLAEILKDVGNACSSHWAQGSTLYASFLLDACYHNAVKLYIKHSVRFVGACLNRVDHHSGEDRRTVSFLFCCGGILRDLQHWFAELFRAAYLLSAKHHSGEDEGYDFNNCPSNSGYKTDVGNFQIFVKLPSRKTLLLWVFDEDTGETLKTLIG